VTELYAAIFAIEKYVTLNWNDIWLENDSLILVKAFGSGFHVTGKLKTR